ESHPGFCVERRVVNRNRLLQVVGVHSVVRFHYAQSVAVGTPRIVEPGSVIKSEGLGDERVVINPFADRVTPPPLFWWGSTFGRPPWLFGILGQFPPVRPDDAPFLIELIQDHNLVRSLYDLLCAGIMKNDA